MWYHYFHSAPARKGSTPPRSGLTHYARIATQNAAVRTRPPRVHDRRYAEGPRLELVHLGAICRARRSGGWRRFHLDDLRQYLGPFFECRTLLFVVAVAVIDFRLSVALPIPFDGFGTLEVDLLCADARVVIELDGGQHLADPVAYRRDRRKDQLLQENGYFVLRFLAEDLGKDLDAVLDAVLRVLARRRQSAARVEPLKFVRRGSE
jgi:hypothetical protein